MKSFPNNRIIIRIVNEIREFLYFEHFVDWHLRYHDFSELEKTIREILQWEIEIVLTEKHKKDAKEIVDKLFNDLPDIKAKLDKDAEAGFLGDPAAYSIDEIILSYPGFFSIFVHRIANYLFRLDIPLIPRMMSEYAHSKTGIDIHPGAAIGENFFIDHGTGVVIGETTIVGNNVKIYQGVTIGALSTQGGQRLSGLKRHPTIQDNVTIYSGTTILGGETVIGHDSVIGGNAFITKSVAANTKIKQ